MDSLHTDRQVSSDQLELIYNNSVRTQGLDYLDDLLEGMDDRDEWRVSGKSMLTAQHDCVCVDLCPVGWGCKIHQLLLCWGVRPPPPPTSVLDMTLNNLMVRFQQCWSFGECGVPLHCHRSQVHSGLEW